MLETPKLNSVNDKGHLLIEGWDAVELARKFGTPLWVVSERTIGNNFRSIRAAVRDRYSNYELAYAMKANHNAAVVALLRSLGVDRIDCVGINQIRIALQAGFKPSQIIFNGSNKMEEELRAAIQIGVDIINVDNIDELQLLGEIAEEHGVRVKVNIRLRPGYDELSESDPDFVRCETGDATNKFGIDVPSGQAFEACQLALALKNVKLLGLHHHIGYTIYPPMRYSLKDDLRRQEVSTKDVMDFAGELKKKLRYQVEVMDLGGGSFRPVPGIEGFGPGRVTEGPTIEQYADTIVSAFRNKLKEHGLGQPKLINEIGGGLVSNSTTLLTTVGRIKGLGGGPRLVGLDASAYTFVRKLIFPTFYFHSVIANKADKQPEEEAILVGQICAPDNITPTTVKLPKVESGDIVAILDQGAYCQSISTQYCAIPRPAAVMVSEKCAEISTERESIEYITMNDRIPARYWQSTT